MKQLMVVHLEEPTILMVKVKNSHSTLQCVEQQNFEDPLCYTSSGLTGNGTIETINVTSNTIKDFLNHNIKSAMLQTPMTGRLNMKCAAWTGYSNFTNNGTNFIGYFKINGVDTDFQGTYKFVPDGTQTSCNYQLHMESSENKYYQRK